MFSLIAENSSLNSNRSILKSPNLNPYQPNQVLQDQSVSYEEKEAGAMASIFTVPV